jgi:hypothetical protein
MGAGTTRPALRDHAQPRSACSKSAVGKAWLPVARRMVQPVALARGRKQKAPRRERGAGSFRRLGRQTVTPFTSNTVRRSAAMARRCLGKARCQIRHARAAALATLASKRVCKLLEKSWQRRPNDVVEQIPAGRAVCARLAFDPIGHLRVVKAAARLQRHPRIDEARDAQGIASARAAWRRD